MVFQRATRQLLKAAMVLLEQAKNQERSTGSTQRNGPKAFWNLTMQSQTQKSELS